MLTINYKYKSIDTYITTCLFTHTFQNWKKRSSLKTDQFKY